MEKPKYYKVTNKVTPIYRTWNVTLLSDIELERWNEYKQTDGYKGSTAEERAARMKQGDQVKVEQWAQQERLGEIPVDENGKTIESEMKQIQTGNGNVVKVPTYKFKLAVGDSLLNEKQFENFKMFIKKDIEQVLKPGQSMADVDTEGFMTFKIVAKPEVVAEPVVEEPVKAKK